VVITENESGRGKGFCVSDVIEYYGHHDGGMNCSKVIVKSHGTGEQRGRATVPSVVPQSEHKKLGEGQGRPGVCIPPHRDNLSLRLRTS